MRFYPLTVLSVEPAAEDAVCVSLEVPAGARAAFEFQAGQYVSVRRSVDGELQQRTYSIVSPPGASPLRLGVRLQPHGRMSRAMAQLKRGESLEVGTPLGRFRTATDPARSRFYVACAAGSGVTPVLSLATHLLACEPRSRLLLLYGNRTSARTMFLEEILALKNRHLDRFSVYFVMSREPQESPLLNGRLDRAKFEALARMLPQIAQADEYFLCGPAGMVSELGAALAALNPGAPVRIERFSATGHPQEPPAEASVAMESATPALAEIEILMDGRRRRFTMAPEDASVLAAAERAGLRLPFSCRSGICATCRAKITAGTAVMAHNIALEPWEVAAGFVLCCQARPTAPRLALSYDEK